MNTAIENILEKHFPALYEKELQEEIAREGNIKELPGGAVLIDKGKKMLSNPGHCPPAKKVLFLS